MSLAEIAAVNDLPTTDDVLTGLGEPMSWSWWPLWDGLVRRLDNARYVAVVPMLFTHAVIWGYIGDTAGYEDRWCFRSGLDAIAAAWVWTGEGEPMGWTRHPMSGRRRPHGDPDLETVDR